MLEISERHFYGCPRSARQRHLAPASLTTRHPSRWIQDRCRRHWMALLREAIGQVSIHFMPPQYWHHADSPTVMWRLSLPFHNDGVDHRAPSTAARGWHPLCVLKITHQQQYLRPNQVSGHQTRHVRCVSRHSRLCSRSSKFTCAVPRHISTGSVASFMAILLSAIVCSSRLNSQALA